MLRCVAFDFDTRSEHDIDPAAVTGAISAGRFVWIDARAEPGAMATLIDRDLAPLLGLGEGVCELLRHHQPDTGYEILPDALHISLAACDYRAGPRGGARIAASRVDVLVTRSFLLVLSREPAEFLERVRREYRDDFARFARSPGFLLYEIFDHLTRSYETLEHELELAVERIQSSLAHHPGAEVFPLAARVAADLVRLRRHVAPARAVAHELGTRRFDQIPETTQPFLQSTASELDRVLTDLTTSREILTDGVALAMSFVSFRTNRIINRLSTVSFIFLPLTFLVGVYGMNFEHQPEYKWELGYHFFWTLAICVAGASIATLYALWRREAAHTPTRAAGAASPDEPEPDDPLKSGGHGSKPG